MVAAYKDGFVPYRPSHATPPAFVGGARSQWNVTYEAATYASNAHHVMDITVVSRPDYVVLVSPGLAELFALVTQLM